MEVIVIFEGKEITNLSKLGAEAFVKQNKGAHIKGVETVAPVVKKKETAAGDVDEPYKRERTQKEAPVAELVEPVEPIEKEAPVAELIKDVEVQEKPKAIENEKEETQVDMPVKPIAPVEVQEGQQAVEDEIDTHYGRKRSKK